MDLSNEYYHSIKVTRYMLTAIGLWPNNSTFKYIQRIFFTLLLTFSICAQLKKILTNTSNFEALLQILSFAVPCLIFSLKYATFCIQSKNIKNLLEQMKYNLNAIKCKTELKILRQYINIGNLIIITGTGIIYLGVIVVLIAQLLPKLLDIFVPLNESRPFNLLGVATYFFDQEKYFVPIYIHMIVALFVEATTLMGTESMCMISTSYAIGLFEITSFRVKHIFDCDLHISVSEKNKIYLANIINAILVHNRAFEFFDYFHSCFEVPYICFLILGVSSVSINLFRLNQALLKKDLDEIIVAGLMVFAHFVYMFITNLVGQFITNTSDRVFYKVCQLPWHSAPVHLQKLLFFIIQRSSKVVIFSLGVIEGGLECFASISSTAMSYFMVFTSVSRQ